MRPAHIEVISNHTLKPHAARLRPVKHTGIGDLELPERQLIHVTSSEVGLREWGGQAEHPPPEEAVDCTWTQPITKLLQLGWFVTATEPVV